MSFDEKVWEMCRKIPKGKVTSYREIGMALRTKAYRAIGQALSRNPYAPKVPCHRVIKSDMTLGGFMGKNENSQKEKLLLSEGIEIIDGKIEKKNLYRF